MSRDKTGLEVTKYIKKIKNMEKILEQNPQRFSLLPVQHHDLWKMYKTAEASFWTAEEIDLAQDISHWRGKN